LSSSRSAVAAVEEATQLSDDIMSSAGKRGSQAQGVTGNAEVVTGDGGIREGTMSGKPIGRRREEWQRRMERGTTSYQVGGPFSSARVSPKLSFRVAEVPSHGRSPLSRPFLPSAPLDLIGYLSFPSFGTQTPSRSTRFHSLLNIYLHLILVLLNLIPKVSVHTFADDGAIFGRFMEYLQADSRCL
jgi:hypothetical protein